MMPSSENFDAVAIGAIVDRYRVDALIGTGGMARVFRATHVDLGTHVALKVLHLASPGIADRFLLEGRLQAKLRHTNIVAVRDVLRVAGSPVLVMDLIDGIGLDSALYTYRANLSQLDELVGGLLAGIEYAHGAGVIHRDLKPANILLDLGGDRVIPRISDFGLAKILVDGPGSTRSGVAMGTPSYMAPELHRDAKNVDERADIFALGALLYELVTGVVALPGPSVIDCYEQATQKRWRSIRDYTPNIPGRIEKAIMAALQPDRDDRPPNVAALRAIWTGGHLAHLHPTVSPWEPQHISELRGVRATAPGVNATNATAEPASLAPAPSPITPYKVPAVTQPIPELSVARASTDLGAEFRPGPPRWLAPVAVAFGVAIIAALIATLAINSVAIWLANAPSDGVAIVQPPPEPVPADSVTAANSVAVPTPATEVAPEVVPAAVPPVNAVPAPVTAPVAVTPPKTVPPKKTPPTTGTRDVVVVPEAVVVAPPTTVAVETPPARDMTKARVSVEGVKGAWLVDKKGNQLAAGDVPPGKYQLVVFFEAGNPTQALELNLTAGSTRSIRCAPSLKVCK